MMPTPYTLDNKVQYVPVAQPMVSAPVTFMPQMVPASFPFQPLPLPPLPTMPMSLPLVSMPSHTSIPAMTPVLYCDGSSFTEVPSNLQSTNDAGCLVAPPGYSFVTMSVPSASVERSVSATREEGESELELLPVPSITERSRSRSSSVVSVHEEPVAETSAPAKKAQQPKKYRHRSKQTRILEVHAQLKEEYTAKGLYAGDDEVLRGFDTVRVHVKTYKALNQIACPLNDVEKHPDVQVLRIATPFSMKNRFQKKGFIVYLKLASPDMVPIVQEIFSHYKEDFAKCDVALKKEDKQALDRQREAMAMKDNLSDVTDKSSTSEFLSTRAYSAQGVQFHDWAMNGL